MIEKFSCFSTEQQKAYNELTQKQRSYVKLRGQGMSKSESYRLAGYKSGQAGQAAYIMERDNKIIAELIQVLLGADVPDGLEVGGKLDKELNKVATDGNNVAIQRIIEAGDSENAKRIQFYRDIVAGKVRSVKRTVRRDANGDIIETKIEESSDVDVKMRARKELDRILCINDLPLLQQSLEVGQTGITINIVDATKREEVDEPKPEVLIEGNEIFEEVQEQDIKGDTGVANKEKGGNEGGGEQ